MRFRIIGIPGFRGPWGFFFVFFSSFKRLLGSANKELWKPLTKNVNIRTSYIIIILVVALARVGNVISRWPYKIIRQSVSIWKATLRQQRRMSAAAPRTSRVYDYIIIIAHCVVFFSPRVVEWTIPISRVPVYAPTRIGRRLTKVPMLLYFHIIISAVAKFVVIRWSPAVTHDGEKFREMYIYYSYTNRTRRVLRALYARAMLLIYNMIFTILRIWEIITAVPSNYGALFEWKNSTILFPFERYLSPRGLIANGIIELQQNIKTIALKQLTTAYRHREVCPRCVFNISTATKNYWKP